jgi:hypothetical protein
MKMKKVIMVVAMMYQGLSATEAWNVWNVHKCEEAGYGKGQASAFLAHLQVLGVSMLCAPSSVGGE